MIVRFGFVAMSVLLEDASTSKTVTWKNYRQLYEKSPDAALHKIRTATKNNLANCLRLLHYCRANFIEVYRFSSKIIPLATHPQLQPWDYLKEFQHEFAELGSFIRQHSLRVTFHPDHFTLINSPKEEVFVAAVRDLAHHTRLFQAMGQKDEAKLIMHIGGQYGNKEAAQERFLDNWARLPNAISRRVILENDDKTFTANETINTCEKLQVPMVLDVHHHYCNHEEEYTLESLLPRFVTTWQKSSLPPKIHVSSPKSKTEPRSHHDYVDAEHVYPVLSALKELTPTLDVMVEAKQKDQAMFRLVSDLQKFSDVKEINRAKLEIK